MSGEPEESEPRKPLMRCIGEFVGHVWRGVVAPVGGPEVETRRAVCREESAGVIGDEVGGEVAKVRLRRTTIEEVEVERR